MIQTVLKYSWPNLKVQLSTIAFAGILIQILSTQGILMFNIFKLLGNWEVKKLLHPIGIIIVLIAVIFALIYKRKILLSNESILLFGYFLLQYSFLIIFKGIDLNSLYYSLRETVLIFVLIASYQLFYLHKKYLNFIAKILIVLTLVNIIFVLITIFIGGEAYMLLVTDRFYWPSDPLLKFKISTFMGLVYRSPGLIGESASVGFFGVFSFFLILNSNLKKYYWLPLILVAISFTRSAYLVIIIYGFLSVFSKKANLKLAISIFPLIVGIFIYTAYVGLFSLRSLWMRVDNWTNKVNLDSNLLFGGNLDKIGAAAPEGIGFASTLDSYWLYLYHGIGLVGIFLVILFFIKKMNSPKKIKFFLISLILAGFFVSYNQSIPFLVFFPLLSISNWWVEDNDYIY